MFTRGRRVDESRVNARERADAWTRVRTHLDARDAARHARGRGRRCGGASARVRGRGGGATRAGGVRGVDGCASARARMRLENGVRAATRVIETCAAHYTAWAHRWACARALASRLDAREVLRAEAAFAARATASHAKNYQAWNHARRATEAMLEMGVMEEEDWSRAYAVVEAALGVDGKNIHAWSHRAWLASRSDARDREEAYTRAMIENDALNNSAWNARFHVVERERELGDVGVLERETAFARDALRADEDNESAWNYMRGVCDLAETSASVDEDVKSRVSRMFVDAARAAASGPTPSRHAALALADRVAAEAARDADPNRAAEAEAIFRDLSRIDPVRANYYRTRADRLRAALS